MSVERRTREGESLDARVRVERSYGSALPDRTWEWLVDNHYIAELDQGDLGIDDVVDVIRDLNKAAPAAQRRARGGEVDGDTSSVIFGALNNRMRAVAEFLARRAHRDLQVQRFRRSCLGGVLLLADDIDGWINDRYWAELPRGWPSISGPSQATNFTGGLLELPASRVELEWLPPDAETVKIWGVPRRSTLGRLAELSTKLSSRWDWHLAHATSFVLTGATPPRPAVRHVRFKPTSGWDDDFGAYRYGGVRFTVDAEVTPEQLAAWWRGIRAEIGMTGKKPIRERAVRLALFSLSRPASSSWRDDMKAWNEHADVGDQFDDLRNFRRAVLRAWSAINLSAPHPSEIK